jgi:hypothetical protein
VVRRGRGGDRGPGVIAVRRHRSQPSCSPASPGRSCLRRSGSNPAGRARAIEKRSQLPAACPRPHLSGKTGPTSTSTRSSRPRPGPCPSACGSHGMTRGRSPHRENAGGLSRDFAAGTASRIPVRRIVNLRSSETHRCDGLRHRRGRARATGVAAAATDRTPARAHRGAISDAVRPGPSAAVLQGSRWASAATSRTGFGTHSQSQASRTSSQSRACTSRVARCRCSACCGSGGGFRGSPDCRHGWPSRT